MPWFSMPLSLTEKALHGPYNKRGALLIWGKRTVAVALHRDLDRGLS